MVLVLVVLASLIGVGGAALWIYNQPEKSANATKRFSPAQKADVSAGQERCFPKLSRLQTDDDTPAQLIPAHYVPAESEIATFSGAPRYTYVSYNGGRQQAHLRVNMVVSETAPIPLPASTSCESKSVLASDNLPPLSDSGSRYITDARGRVIGVDGTVNEQRIAVAQAVQPVRIEPEVRVASPVITRKAMPVDDESVTVPATTTFDVRSELAREDEHPVLRAMPVSRSTGNIRPAMFGASDHFHSFGNN